MRTPEFKYGLCYVKKERRAVVFGEIPWIERVLNIEAKFLHFEHNFDFRNAFNVRYKDRILLRFMLFYIV